MRKPKDGSPPKDDEMRVLILTVDRLIERSLYRPSRIDSSVKQRSVDAGSFFPFWSGKAAAPVGNQLAASPITALLFVGGPLTVVRRIGPIIINSFERVVWGRAGAHVSKEPLEGFPLGCDGNSPASISSVVGSGRDETSPPHSGPAPISKRSGLVVPASGGAVRGGHFPPQTTARFCSSTFDVAQRSNQFSAALAFKPPSIISRAATPLAGLDGHKPPKSPAGKRFISPIVVVSSAGLRAPVLQVNSEHNALSATVATAVPVRIRTSAITSGSDGMRERENDPHVEALPGQVLNRHEPIIHGIYLNGSTTCQCTHGPDLSKERERR